jgi:hypothetical protein
MSQKWKELQVGDKVRVIAWPDELIEERLHADTIEFYRWLIQTKTVLSVVEIDETGLPWGEHRRVVNGRAETESIALNHGGIEVVERAPER